MSLSNFQREGPNTKETKKPQNYRAATVFSFLSLGLWLTGIFIGSLLSLGALILHKLIRFVVPGDERPRDDEGQRPRTVKHDIGDPSAYAAVRYFVCSFSSVGLSPGAHSRRLRDRTIAVAARTQRRQVSRDFRNLSCASKKLFWRP
jgi:hypothetical protein